MNELVLITQVVVEDQSRNDGEDPQDSCDQAGFVAQDEYGGEAELYHQCHDVAEVWEWESA